MRIAWGVVVIALSVVCWGGQTFSWFFSRGAVELGLTEAESDVEPVFWRDSRGEALWDLLVLWTMPVAGVLLVADHDWWPYFGLVGGGSYLYFAGRGIVVRLMMRRHGLRIGSPSSVAVGLAGLAIWGVMAVITIVAAVIALEGG